MQLRPYQQLAHDSTVAFIHKEVGNGIVVAECSAGKSLMIARIAEHLHECKQRVLVLADRSKLLKQNFAKFSNPEDVGIVSAGLGSDDYSRPITVAGIQTIYNKADQLGHIDWVLIDECHAVSNDFSSDSRYHRFLRCYPNARILGYTATFFSLAEGALTWGKVIHEITYQQLLEAGFCVPLTNKIGDEPDLSKVKHNGPEFNLVALGEYMRQAPLIEMAAQKTASYIQTMGRKKTLGFCVDIEHAYAMFQALKPYGFKIDMVHGEHPETRRAEIYDDFENGPTDILLNVELLTKGADFPCIDCIVNYRPTESLALWSQMIGRGIRLYPDKTKCLLLDFTGNLRKFGTLGNPIWKYFGSEKKKVGKAQKICPACECSVNIGQTECSECGYIFLKEDVERELKHEADADVNSDMSKPHNPEKYYKVNNIVYSHHKSKAGNESLRVEYLSGRFSVSEYIPFGLKAPWAFKKCHDFIKYRSNMLPETISEALELCESWRKPKMIKVRPQKNNPKYFELVGVEEWEETKKQPAQEAFAAM